jgi:Fe-S-cluster containining protein
MNVPAVVKKTFDELRDRPEYTAILNFALEALKKISNPIARARYVHKEVNAFNVEAFSHPLVQQLSPCKLGCTACCHTQVSVTEDEAKLLAHLITDGTTVDEDRLRLQHAAGNDSGKFYGLKYEDRKCIFLNENGACRIYEDRPSVCRTNAVLGRPEQCDTRDGIQPTRLVRTPKSDMVIYAHYLSSSKAGTLPYMVGEALGIKASAE